MDVVQGVILRRVFWREGEGQRKNIEERERERGVSCETGVLLRADPARDHCETEFTTKGCETATATVLATLFT